MHQSYRLEPDQSRGEFLKYALQFDDLAFVRRARGVQQAWLELLGQCRSKRKELLELPRIRLAILAALLGGRWSRLEPLLTGPPDAAYLDELFRQWRPRLRAEVRATTSPRRMHLAVRELVASLERFNRLWQEFVSALDLQAINRVREDYNRYYVIEKACAFASEYLGSDGFEALPTLTAGDLLREFPLLHVPQLRRRA